MEKVVYADHSATTYVKEEVLQEMLPYYTQKFGNASSVYSIGRVAKAAIDKARCQVATAIGAKCDEIYFTAGGSESDNMIIAGVAKKYREKGNHIITSKIEHLAVLNTCRMLEKEGFEVTYLDVDKEGFVRIEEVERAIRPNTILISIMFANNEIGTIQEIEKIGRLAHQKHIFFHTDAVQAIGNVKIDVNQLNIDLLSLSAHKFYGPKGVGAAYIKNEIEFVPLIQGGHQEKSKRAGTENVAGIVGLGKAIEISNGKIEAYNEKLLKYRKIFLEKLENNLDFYKINGSLTNRLPGNVNVSVSGLDSQTLLTMLDMYGICASSGSACNSSVIEPSHVLTAIGLQKELAISSIRFTFGDENTIEDIEYTANTFITIVKKLRRERMNLPHSSYYSGYGRCGRCCY